MNSCRQLYQLHDLFEKLAQSRTDDTKFGEQYLLSVRRIHLLSRAQLTGWLQKSLFF